MNKRTIEKYLDRCGEVLIYTCDGEVFELHQHDTKIEPPNIIIDKGEEKHIIDYDYVVSLDVHESGRE